MKSKVVILFSLVLVVFCLFVVVWNQNIKDDTSTTPNTPDSDDSIVVDTHETEETTKDTETTDSVTEEKEQIIITPDQLTDTIYGIPKVLFEKTSGRNFNFALSNTITGASIILDPTAKLSDLDYQFYESDYSDDIEIIPDAPVQPGEVSLTVKLGNPTTNIFSFGSINESNEPLSAEEARLIYVSYRGNTDWSLCGVQTHMTREQVIDVLGTATQEMNSTLGYVMEYYILQDEHVYIINVIFDDTNTVSKITVNIDNHKIY